MADARISFKRLMQDEDDPQEPGKVTPEPKGAQARLGVNSIAHGNDVPPTFYTTLSYAAAYEVAFNLFKKYYWNALRGDEIENYAVANKLANLAYNMGCKPVIKFVQETLNLPADGVFGLHTLNAVNMHDPDTLVKSVVELACDHYRELATEHPELARYLPNWLARANKLN